MAVNLNRVLHSNFDEFRFTIGGYRDGAFAVRRYFPAIDIFSGHGCLLDFVTKSCVLRVMIRLRACAD
jgi:hypothetical protein